MRNNEQKGKWVEAEIVDIAFGGEGVARHDGEVIFIPFAAMGEKIKVRIIESRKKFMRGAIDEIVRPSPDREEPPCEYYKKCGGCQYQHISYEAELKAKGKQLMDQLTRIGKIESPNVRPIHHAKPYGYRNRITVHNSRGMVGFRSVDGRELIDIKKCLLASDAVNRKLTKLREQVRPREHYSIRADEVKGEAFYQTNRMLMECLQKTAEEALPEGIDSMVEGYAGVGFFTEIFAPKVKKMITIESDPRAVEVAMQNKLPNVEYMLGTCEEKLAQACGKMSGVSACMIDPPREGLSDVVRQDLLNAPFKHILYLSCNPSTLSRDLLALSAKWKPRYFQPIDLFPRTAHLECFTVLDRI